ncbi:MAG: prepilin-type N-terminal cleavage/methylation domain-containing protein, partial [Luminiphilus sp.]|nr:prepilin-type N-terminal cleavage/methylation domain-containing protein [Luminiphilus sp.]
MTKQSGFSLIEILVVLV